MVKPPRPLKPPPGGPPPGGVEADGVLVSAANSAGARDSRPPTASNAIIFVDFISFVLLLFYFQYRIRRAFCRTAGCWVRREARQKVTGRTTLLPPISRFFQCP